MRITQGGVGGMGIDELNFGLDGINARWILVRRRTASSSAKVSGLMWG